PCGLPPSTSRAPSAATAPSANSATSSSPPARPSPPLALADRCRVRVAFRHRPQGGRRERDRGVTQSLDSCVWWLVRRPPTEGWVGTACPSETRGFWVLRRFRRASVATRQATGRLALHGATEDRRHR